MQPIRKNLMFMVLTAITTMATITTALPSQSADASYRGATNPAGVAAERNIRSAIYGLTMAK